MPNEKQSPPYMLWGASLAIVLSPLPALLTQVIQSSHNTTLGLMALTLSLLAFGIGEVLNHPAHSGNRYTKDSEPNRFVRINQRKRTPSGLGNLLVLSSILLLFIGIGKIIAP